MRSVRVDPWGKPYKIVMNKFRKTGPPESETLSRSFLNTVLDTLFPTRTNRYPLVCPAWGVDDKDVSIEELRTAVRRMKNGVAPGPDGVTSEAIIKAYDDIQHALENTFSKCLREGHFPPPKNMEGRKVGAN